MKICERPECARVYQPKTHNQKYCNPDCCKVATNRRVMEKYYEKQAKRRGKERRCLECNRTKLSRYNETTICGPCSLRKQEEARRNVVSMFAAVSWQ